MYQPSYRGWCLDFKDVGVGGAIEGTHTSSDILLKNDQNNKHDYNFGKRQQFIFNRF